jgi:hypothetical protein
MSQQEPAFYNLEFDGEAPFWDGAGDVSRRTFVMPLSNPVEFLAFGVVGPATTVHFVARGRMGEQLGEFSTRMARAGAALELYARPPLPWHLVKRYTSDEPYESMETEGPKPPPINGIVAYGGGADEEQRLVQTEPLGGACPSWPRDATSNRSVIIIPVPDCDEDFLAFGVCTLPDRFVFAVRGRVVEDLGTFIDQMTEAGATVDLVDWPSLPFLQAYLYEQAPHLFTRPTLMAGTGHVLASPGAVA